MLLLGSTPNLPVDGQSDTVVCGCSRVDELYFSDARSQLWDAVVVEYAASSAAIKETYAGVVEYL